MEPLQRLTLPTVQVLNVLLNADGPIWGLMIVQQTGRPAGTVYPLLGRLEQMGWLTSRWDDDQARHGPRRRLYDFTTSGRQAAVNAAAASMPG